MTRKDFCHCQNYPFNYHSINNRVVNSTYFLSSLKVLYRTVKIIDKKQKRKKERIWKEEHLVDEKFKVDVEDTRPRHIDA